MLQPAQIERCNEIENGLTNYDELAARAEQAGEKFEASSKRIKGPADSLY